MKVLFVIDRLELKYFEFNKLVTNFWIIKKLLQNNSTVDITTIDMLKIKSTVAYTSCYEAEIQGEEIIYNKNTQKENKINDYDLVMFRPDPPVDLDYINATYIFDFVDKSKTVIMNDTTAIRNFNEKLHAILFNEFMPENIITSSKKDIVDFLNKHEEIILKPLNQCFGGGVMYLKKGDNNIAVIINSMTANETKLIMVQKYIPKAVFGDKRVLILGDKVLPYCVQKTPSNDDFKFCEHDDEHVIKGELSPKEISDFSIIAKKLNELNIYMAGLDVIDGKIIEVNVTSPCYFIKENNRYYNCHLEDEIISYLEIFVHDKLYANVQ